MDHSALTVGVLAALMLVACDKFPQAGKTGSTRTLEELDGAVKRLEVESVRARIDMDFANKRFEQEGVGKRWVLWRSRTSLDFLQLSLPFLALDGFATKGQCDEGLRARITDGMQAGSSLVTKTSLQTTDQKSGRVVYEFYCLPDSVDPRQASPTAVR